VVHFILWISTKDRHFSYLNVFLKIL